MTVEPRDGRPPSLILAGAVMRALSLWFWLPIAGPFIAGGVGARMAGNPGRAIAPALIPAVLMGLMIVLVLRAFDLPVLGTVAGVGVGLVVLVQDLPLIVGAAVGGATTT